MRDLEKLGTTLVGVYPEVKGDFDVDQLRDIIGDDLEPSSPIGMPLVTFRLRSVRSQIVVAVESKKVQVADQSEDLPAKEGFVSKALAIFAHTAAVPATAHGWNLDYTFKTNAESAGTEIAARLISERAQEAFRAELVGASVQLTYESGGVRYTFKLEPRRQRLETDVFFAHLNSNYEAPIPSEEEAAAAELQHAHDELLRTLREMFP